MSVLAITRAEWPLLRASRVLWGSLALLAALLLAAAANGRAATERAARLASELQAQWRTTADGLRAQLERYERSGGQAERPVAADPGAVGFSALAAPAVLGGNPLAALTTGQSDLFPAHYQVTAHAAHTLAAGRDLESPWRLAVGSFDASFVVLFVLPMLVIALCFDVVSREREQGTLALAAAQGSRPRDFIAGKLLARAGTVLVLTVLAAALALFVATGAELATEDWVRAALWIGAVVLYAAFWLALALYVNALRRPSDANGVLLANAWLLLVVLMPAAVNLAATTLYPAPSRVELTTALREASEEADEAAAEAREQYFFDHPELAGGDIDPFDYYRIVAETEERVARSIAPRLEAFERQSEKRAAVVGVLQYLSPAMLAQQLLAASAGTDAVRYERFREQMLAYHEGWRGFFLERVNGRRALSSVDYGRLRVFSEQREALGALVARIALPALALIVATAALATLALRRFRSFAIA